MALFIKVKFAIIECCRYNGKKIIWNNPTKDGWLSVMNGN